VLEIANGVSENQFEETTLLPVSSICGQITEIPEIEKSLEHGRVMNFDFYVMPAYNGKHIAGEQLLH